MSRPGDEDGPDLVLRTLRLRWVWMWLRCWPWPEWCPDSSEFAVGWRYVLIASVPTQRAVGPWDVEETGEEAEASCLYCYSGSGADGEMAAPRRLGLQVVLEAKP